MFRYITILILCIFPVIHAETVWNPEGYTKLKYLGESATSDDQQFFAIVYKEIQREIPAWTWTLRIESTEGTNSWEVIRAESPISQLSCSKDGEKVYFIADADGSRQLFCYNHASQSARPITRLKGTTISYFPGPDGEQILFLIRLPKSQNTLFLASVGLDTLSDNPDIPLTPINQLDVPSHVTDYAWSPDGQSIAFIVWPSSSPNDSMEGSIHLHSLVNGRTQQVTSPDKGGSAVKHLTFHPDGKSLVFAQSHPISERSRIGHWQIARLVLSTGQVTTFDTFDGNPLKFIGYTTDQALLFVETFHHNNNIYALSFDQGTIERISDEDMHILSPKLNNSSQVLSFVSEDHTKPQELFLARISHKISGEVEQDVASASSSNAREHCHVDKARAFGYEDGATGCSNSPRVCEKYGLATLNPFVPTQLTKLQVIGPDLHLGKTETIHWSSSDGTIIEGLLTFPSNYIEGKRYPLLVELHGGPASKWQTKFIGSPTGSDHPNIEAIYSTRGYFILRPNIRGSTGYGVPFRFAIRKDWGGGDVDDVLTGLDYLVERGMVDTSRIAAYGWSYGGYLTNWLATQTNYFSAIVSGAGISDFPTFSMTTDIPNYLYSYFGCHYSECPTYYADHSPLLYAKRVQAPILFIHGELDPRVPASQAQIFFDALTAANKETKILLLDKQGHGLSNPEKLTEAVEATFQWIDSNINK